MSQTEGDIQVHFKNMTEEVSEESDSGSWKRKYFYVGSYKHESDLVLSCSPGPSGATAQTMEADFQFLTPNNYTI